MKVKLSIVVPCYNEAQNIPLILKRFANVVTRKDIEVIFVNNGSTDESEVILKKLIPKYGFAKIVKVIINQGYGHGILSGLKNCKGEYIGWTHADMQTDPGDCIKALELIENHSNTADIYVKGLRRGRPFFDQVFTYGMSLFETVYMKTRLFDINAQPNVFHRSFFKKWQAAPKDFSLDLYALYMAHRFKLNVIRFAVEFPERIHGESKWNTGLLSKWKFIKRTMAFSRKLKRSVKNPSGS